MELKLGRWKTAATARSAGTAPVATIKNVAFVTVGVLFSPEEFVHGELLSTGNLKTASYCTCTLTVCSPVQAIIMCHWLPEGIVVMSVLFSSNQNTLCILTAQCMYIIAKINKLHLLPVHVHRLG